MKPEQSSDSVTLKARMLGETQAQVEIPMHHTVFTRLREHYEKIGMVPKVVGAAVIFVAAAVAVKKISQHHHSDEVIAAPKLNALQQEEYTRMFESCWPRIESYYLFSGYSPDEAQEQAQKVFSRALNSFPSFTPIAEIENPYMPWLYTIARNLRTNYTRDTRRRKDSFSLNQVEEDNENHPSLAEKTLGPERQTERNEENTHFIEAVNRLLPSHRLVIWLHTESGLTNKDIAQILGNTENGVKSLYHRALGRLSQELKKDHV